MSFYLICHNLKDPKRLKLFNDAIKKSFSVPCTRHILENVWLVIYGGKAPHLERQLMFQFDTYNKERCFIAEITLNYRVVSLDHESSYWVEGLLGTAEAYRKDNMP